jgi:peptidoglycan/xylan/chitin deacetylase (PgdA/CDA1 family)
MTERRRRRLALTSAALGVAFALGVILGARGHDGSAQPLHPAAAVSSKGRRTQESGGGRSTAEPVPILMYHVLGDAPAGAPFPDLFVKPADFAGQMRWLAGNGFHAVSLDAVWKHWHGTGTLPSHPVVVSFDDGYRSQYTNALPVLRSHRWPGVLNLEVADTTKSWGTRPRMVRAMIAAGWEVEAHTLTHPDLTRLDEAELRRQVAGSRTVIRRTYHVPVDFFCYPAGRYDARVVAAVRAAGYLGATTVDFGLARPSELYTLKRVRVARGEGVSGLRSSLAALGLH